MDRRNSADRQLRERAHAVIPGGMYGHGSLSRMPEDFPQFCSRAKGARLWDADGNELIDLMCAYGVNLFGYGDALINAAYARQMEQGDTMTCPTGLIVELAELLTAMVSHADWAMFCKNGTDATSMAMVVSRAHTGRKTLVRAKGAYHGTAPWCTPNLRGIPPEDRANQLFCTYNDVASLEAAAAAAGDDLAAILAAPFRHDSYVDQCLPDPAYARRARELCDQTGALLIVDDIRAGFRVARDCSWSVVGVEPDLSTWGKCIANGHAISALLGSDKARDAAASIWAAGSFWYQAAPMSAAIETLRRVRDTGYLEHLNTLGSMLRAGLAERAAAHGLGLRQTGPATMPIFLFDDDPDLRKGFCWSNEMLRRGVYTHPSHNMFMCEAMTPADIEQVLDAADGAFRSLKIQAPTLAPNEKHSVPIG